MLKACWKVYNLSPTPFLTLNNQGFHAGFCFRTWNLPIQKRGMTELNAGLVKHSFSFQSIPLGFYEWGRESTFERSRKSVWYPWSFWSAARWETSREFNALNSNPPVQVVSCMTCLCIFYLLCYFRLKISTLGTKKWPLFSSFRWGRGNLHHRFITYLLITYRTSALSVAITHTSEIRRFIKKCIQLTDLKAKVQVCVAPCV